MIHKIDKEIYRGPRPNDLTALRKDLHIDTMIDLESGVYEMLYDVSQFPPDFGMSYYHMPCSDIFPPPRNYVEKCLALMRQDRVIYLHCLSGVDRTGFVAAVYRMQVQGWGFDLALREWKSLGRHFWYFYWERELKKYAPSLI